MVYATKRSSASRPTGSRNVEAYPSGTRTVLIFNESEVGHEILDFGILAGKIVEAAFCLTVAKGRDVGVLHVVANSVANGIDPPDLAAEHLGKLVGL